MVTDKIQLQPVQQEITQEVTSFDRNSMGYTDRPIDQRRQVRNVYLDSVQGVESIVIGDGVETVIDHYTYYKTGNLPWDITDGEFNISLSGTYIVQVDFSTETVGGELTLTIYNGTTDIYTRSKVIDSLFEKEQDISRTFQFTKGDKITCSLTQTSGGDSGVSIIVSIIKIS